MVYTERPRDCSPGHAGKEGLHLAMTEASRGFSGAGQFAKKKTLTLHKVGPCPSLNGKAIAEL